jgi:hypothetical protein
MNEAILWISGGLWNWGILPVNAHSITGAPGNCGFIARRDNERRLFGRGQGDRLLAKASHGSARIFTFSGEKICE